MQHYRPLLILLTGAIVGTVLVLGMAVYAQTLFQKNNAYFFDAVYYQSYNAALAQRLQTESRFSVALDEWLHNDRQPLRTAPLALLAPSLLSNPYGHLITTGLTLTLLLVLVGYVVYSRRQSLWLALGAQILLTAVPLYYDSYRGIANYWLEWGAALWLGCAVCFLLLAIDFPKQQRWIIGFALSAAAATLSRYIASMFVATVCIVPFGFYLWRRWQLQRQWRDVIVGAALPLCIILVSAGYFLLAHLSSNIAFYRDYGYAINQTFTSSWQFIHTSLLVMWQLTGRVQYLFIYTSLVVLGLNLILTLRRQTIGQWVVALWISLAVPVTLLGLRTVGALHPLIYGLFPVIVASVAPAQEMTLNRWKKFLHIGIVALLVFVAAVSLAQQRWKIITLAGQTLSPEKYFNQQLVDGFAQVDDSSIVWQGYFDEYSTIPTMELYYATGQLALAAGQPFFNRQITAWQADYPGLTKEQVAERVYAGTGEWVDVAVVFIDPDQGRLNGWMLNDYSRQVADYMARTLPTDPQWEKVFTIESPFYSTLVGYRNLSPRSDNYEVRLRTPAIVRP